MKWANFVLFFFASISVCLCSQHTAVSDCSPEIIEEFKKLELAFVTKRIAELREDSSCSFQDGSHCLSFSDLCKRAFEYALFELNWPFANNLFNEFWRNHSILKILPFTGLYCLLALSHNDMNQTKISFSLIQNATDKKIVLFQALRERKFVLVGFEPMMNWDLLSQTDFIRIFRSAIKYKQFSQVYQCLGYKAGNFALLDNNLLRFAVQHGQKVAIEILLAHYEVFATRPEDIDISTLIPDVHAKLSYSEYLCYYYSRVHTNEHLLRPFWQNFYRLDCIDPNLAVLLLTGLERTPLAHGQSPYTCLARIVRIISVSDLSISSLKKFRLYFDNFGAFNIAINSGNTRFIDYVLKRYDPISFQFDAVAFAEVSLTKGTCYLLNNPAFIRLLKASYCKGHLDLIISILRLVGQHSSFNKTQSTQITKSLIMNIPEIVWILSKSITPFYFNPRECCWLTEAVHLTDYTETLPRGYGISEKWRDLMIVRVYSGHMMRLILATYGVYDEATSKALITICLQVDDYDSALMAFKSAHGQFQLDSPRPFLPGIINHDLSFAEKLFSPRRFFPVIKLKEPFPSCHFAQDRRFYGMLLSSIIGIIEAGHKPLLRYILNNFDIRPHDILSIPQFAPHHKIIGACYGRPDLSKICFKSYGPVPVFLASCPLIKVNVVLPYLGMMNTLQLINACLLLESEKDI